MGESNGNVDVSRVIALIDAMVESVRRYEGEATIMEMALAAKSLYIASIASAMSFAEFDADPHGLADERFERIAEDIKESMPWVDLG